MGPLAIMFGLAGAGVFALNLAASGGGRSNIDGLWLSVMLFATWGASNLARAVAPLPWAWLPSAPMDLACLVVVAMVAASTGRAWTWLLAATFLFELALHVAFWLAWLRLPRDPMTSWQLFWWYVLLRNVAFSAQLLILAWPGGAHVLAGLGSALAGHLVPALRRVRR